MLPETTAIKRWQNNNNKTILLQEKGLWRWYMGAVWGGGGGGGGE